MRVLSLCLTILGSLPLSAADPAPSYAGGDGRAFWYASILDWRFKADGYAQNTLGDDLMPERLVEVLVWRGQVINRQDGNGAAQWQASDALCWRASGRTTDADAGVEGARCEWPFAMLGGSFSQQLVAGTAQCLPGDGTIIIDTATATVPGYRMQNGHDFGVVITGLGLPDLALPTRPSAGATMQLQPAIDGVAVWSWSEPVFQRKLDHFISSRVNLGGMAVQVSLSALAQGKVAGRMALDEQVHLPVWSSLAAEFTVTLTPELAQPAAPGQAISGVLTMRRHAWRLADQDRAQLPKALPALLKSFAVTAMIEGQPRSWATLAKDGDPTWARVAKGVLLAGANPLQPVQAHGQ